MPTIVVSGVALVALIVGSLFLAKVLRPRPETQTANLSTLYENTVNWDEIGGVGLKISVFAFRDLNKNGAYDLKDRPMAGVGFELLGPDNQRVVKGSNINGFANFIRSAHKKEGEYSYRALTPPGWELTTHNETQRTSFKIRRDSRGKVISTTPAAPVGFAPSLTIVGRAEVSPTDIVKLVATSPSGNTADVPLSKEGTFQIAAESGEWLIEASNHSGVRAKRAVNVNNVPVTLSEVKFGQADAGIAAHTVTLGFDDLIKTQSVLELPGGYGGLNWQNWVVTHKETYGGEGYVNSTMSGEYVAYNSSGHPVKVFSDKPFDFVGGYFGVAWPDAEGETLKLQAWRGDKLAYEDEIKLSSLGPVYFDASYVKVTRLKLSTLHYWQFVCDDLSFGFRQ
jgi:hypothetical protein